MIAHAIALSGTLLVSLTARNRHRFLNARGTTLLAKTVVAAKDFPSLHNLCRNTTPVSRCETTQTRTNTKQASKTTTNDNNKRRQERTNQVPFSGSSAPAAAGQSLYSGGLRRCSPPPATVHTCAASARAAGYGRSGSSPRRPATGCRQLTEFGGQSRNI